MSIWKRKKYIDGKDYHSNKDYTAEMNKAKEKEDIASLAQLEEERNRKIEAEGLGYAKTYDYIDIGTKIENGIRDGISADEMNELLFARRDKAIKNEHLNEFKNDEIQKRGLKYYYDLTSGAGVNNSNRPEKDTYYEERINELFSKIENAKAFQYDLESDDVYNVLKETLNEQAKKASEDTLANLSQMGGGINSYAVAASTMAANNYNQKLAEQVPKLYQLALDRYIKERELEFNKLDAAIQIDNIKQAQYENDMYRHDVDRKYAASMYNNDLERMLSEDKYEDANKQSEREEALKLMEYYQKHGIKVPKAVLEQAGLSEQEAESNQISSIYEEQINNQNEYDRAKILKASYSSSKQTKSKTEKEEESETLASYGGAAVLNETNGDNIIIDGREISEEELAEMLRTGQVVIKQTPNGIIYTFAN